MMMKNIMVRPALITGVGFSGVFAAFKFVELISQSSLWVLYILLILDIFFLFTYRKIKSNTQATIIDLSDYKIVFIAAFLVGFCAIVIVSTLWIVLSFALLLLFQLYL